MGSWVRSWTQFCQFDTFLNNYVGNKWADRHAMRDSWYFESYKKTNQTNHKQVEHFPPFRRIMICRCIWATLMYLFSFHLRFHRPTEITRDPPAITTIQTKLRYHYGIWPAFRMGSYIQDCREGRETKVWCDCGVYPLESHETRLTQHRYRWWGRYYSAMRTAAEINEFSISIKWLAFTWKRATKLRITILLLICFSES